MMLKGAIVGLGNVAIHGHLSGWEGCDRAEIVAAADSLESRLVQQRSRLPRARFYTDVGALLESESLDFIDVCTPPGTHAAIVRLALGRGVHVLCEKPLVLSLEELRVVGDARAKRGCVLYTVHNWRYAPIIMKATDLIRSGGIGAVRRVRWETFRHGPVLSAVQGAQSDNWRLDPGMAGGGVLLDHGWHALYIILQWVGGGPQTVAASLEKRGRPEWPVEDTATLRLGFREAVADVFLTWASSRRDNRAEVVGTRGTIRVEDETLILADEGGERSWTFDQPLSQGSYHPEWFCQVREHFLSEISGGTQKGENLVMASLCVQLVQLAKESHTRGGRPLALR